jgi:hypothetical protein
VQVLANALPGFRDLRAPVIAGYLWLLFAWLLIDPNLDKAPGDRLGAAAFHLGHTIGHVAIAIAISVCAYLLGSASQAASNFFRSDLVASLWSSLFTQNTWSEPETPNTEIERLLALAHRRIDEESRERPADEHGAAQADYSRAQIEAQGRGEEARRGAERELRLPATLLVGNEPALFAEVDRLRAEGELRITVIPPLLALTILASLSSPLWLFALPVLAVLLSQGVQHERDSRELIANAFTQGIIKSQSVERYREWVDSLKQVSF